VVPSLAVVLPLQPLTTIEQATSQIAGTRAAATRLGLRIEFMMNATLSFALERLPSWVMPKLGESIDAARDAPHWAIAVWWGRCPR
jgi:hypothetical protein